MQALSDVHFFAVGLAAVSSRCHAPAGRRLSLRNVSTSAAASVDAATTPRGKGAVIIAVRRKASG